MTILGASASFLSLPYSGRLKSSGSKKRKQAELISLSYVLYGEKGVGILTDSCLKFNVFVFSAPDFAARRTIVRLARRNRTLQTIFSLPDSGRLKKALPINLLANAAHVVYNDFGYTELHAFAGRMLSDENATGRKNIADV